MIAEVAGETLLQEWGIEGIKEKCIIIALLILLLITIPKIKRIWDKISGKSDTR